MFVKDENNCEFRGGHPCPSRSSFSTILPFFKRNGVWRGALLVCLPGIYPVTGWGANFSFFLAIFICVFILPPPFLLQAPSSLTGKRGELLRLGLLEG